MLSRKTWPLARFGGNIITDPRKWYRTQKEHRIGWLIEYDTPGAYKCVHYLILGRIILEGGNTYET